MAPPVEVRRSARRKRTVSAYRQDGTVVVLIPARFTRAEEDQWVATMVARLERSAARQRPSDDELMGRAHALSRTHLDGRARPVSVRWVDTMAARWGSCTPSAGTIRLSDRLRGFPAWVVDYVLLHELVHLLEPSHNDRFWRLVSGYPRTERARGFLDGVAHAAGLDLSDVDGPEPG